MRLTLKRSTSLVISRSLKARAHLALADDISTSLLLISPNTELAVARAIGDLRLISRREVVDTEHDVEGWAINNLSISGRGVPLLASRASSIGIRAGLVPKVLVHLRGEAVTEARPDEVALHPEGHRLSGHD